MTGTRWTESEKEIMRKHSTPEEWMSPTELGIMLGRSPKSISYYRRTADLRPTKEQRENIKNFYRRKELMVKVCPDCGNTFQTTRSNRIFCDRKCHSLHRYKESLETKPCEKCGKQFTTKRLGARFCSKKCRFADRDNRITITCRCCGKKFKHSSNRPRIYCSDKCCWRWKQEHSQWKTWHKVCPACGKEFEARYPHMKYCSKECAFHRKRPDLGQRNKEIAKFDENKFLVSYGQGKTDREMAKEQGMSIAGIACQRRKRDLNPNPIPRKLTEEKFLPLYKKGLSDREIARQLQIDPSHVNYLRLNLGLAGNRRPHPLKDRMGFNIRMTPNMKKFLEIQKNRCGYLRKLIEADMKRNEQ